jgi:hypothetical protein
MDSPVRLPRRQSRRFTGVPVKTFEYKILPRLVQEEELNALGKQGWDLVAAPYGGKWILKRTLESSPIHEPQKSTNPSGGMEW